MQKKELQVAIVKTLRNEGMHGYRIKGELEKEGISISHTNLYSVLREMEEGGLVKSLWETSPYGPQKRVYLLDKKGKEGLRRILGEAISVIFGFYSEYIVPRIFDLMEVSVSDNFCYVFFEHFATVDKTVLKQLCQKFPDQKIFYVKPKSYDIHFEAENLVRLDGNLENIPLKDEFLDAIGVLDISRGNIKTAVKEYWRVLKKGGNLIIVTPLTREFVESFYLVEFIHDAVKELLHLTIIDVEEMKATLERNGFKVDMKRDRELVLFSAFKVGK